MRSALSKAIVLGLAVVTTSVMSCSSDSNKGSNSAEATSGSVGLQLTVAPGVTINAVTYTITGPTNKTGTINVTNTQTITEVIGGLAAGSGYTISLNAVSTDGSLNCLGSATFTVVARATSVVNVALTCKRAGTTGAVLVNGILNVCPVIDSVSATAPVNGVVQLSSSASDIDHVPAALTYAWSVVAGGTGAGTLSSATAQNPTVNCTAAGSVNLSLVISDSDVNCVATDRTFTTTVTCATGSTTPDAGGTGGAGGAGGGDAGPEAAAGSGGSTAGSGGSTAGSGGSTAGSGGGSTDGGDAAAGSGGSKDGGDGAVACVPNASCLACETDQCPDFITGCNAFAGAQRQLCLDLVKCVRDTSCHSNNTLDCYCGTADATQCLATTGTVIANGACKAQIEAAQGSTSPTAIQNAYTDISNPGGAAMSLALCDNAVCATQCIPYGTTCP